MRHLIATATLSLSEAPVRLARRRARASSSAQSAIPRRMSQVTVEGLARSHYEQEGVARLYGQRGDLSEEILLDALRDWSDMPSAVRPSRRTLTADEVAELAECASRGPNGMRRVLCR